ncbi:MAG: glycoside hydrolase TIM-barrel-like domain-containing protein [Pseudomonadota bacterium]
MATLVLGAVGATVGGSLGGSLLGVSAAVVGRAVGATVGRAIDQRIMGAGSEAIEHGRVDRFRLVGASEGTPIPRIVGRTRVGGQIIWATRFKEHRTESGGGKGAPSQTSTTSYSYSVSLAVALCQGEITRVGRIWADGTELPLSSVEMRVYTGGEDQAPDGLIEAVEGETGVPAYRGLAYVVLEDLDLAPYGNRVPQLSFEVVRNVAVKGLVPAPAHLVQGVALVPGTGEYSLSTTSVHYTHGIGQRDSANVNTRQDVSDFSVTLRDLTAELPNLKSVSVVVSWFGNDLRCGSCEIAPAVEQNEVDGQPMPWSVGSTTRSIARLVPYKDDRPVYGGTPSDQSVIEAIRAMVARGIDVMFYPFILMDQQEGNDLPNPWGGDEQPVLPWRGRITTTLAPGQPGTPDRTSVARDEVDAFFGTASATDFVIGTMGVEYHGPDEWSYRRFILHYAALCASAGGVESFCIGSEMRALTQIRGESDSFPAVEQLVALAAEVRVLLPDAKLSYAADWSEYFGYHPEDTGNVHFHLDPLWASPDIDFIGIDNYMPLADWRDGDDHADAGFRDTLSLEYLRSQIEGGEGYDWYYPTQEARDAQRRISITDGASSEPWVYRNKDLRNWWANPHHDRIAGIRSDVPTAWVPGSKPIRFTEYGCAAIDKGANQPNKFLDPKSSESALPHYSTGRRDDAMQMQYTRALLSYWGEKGRNPVSADTGLPMLDLQHSYIWAWDARPWPAFPELREFWSDGDNYERGHWLSGRSGYQPLAVVIAALCETAGLVSYDVSEVYGVVRGYTMTSSQSARADLQPLMMAYGVEVAEERGVLRFFMRRNAIEHTVPRDMLARHDGPLVSVQQASRADVPDRVRIQHQDAEGSFSARVGDAAQPGTTGLSISESELPLSLTLGEGHALAERFLSEARISRDSLETSLPPSRRDVRVGDILKLDGGSEAWRVDRIEDTQSRKVEAVRVEKHVFEPSDAVEERTSSLRPRAALPVDAILMDLPLLTGEEVPHAPYIAVSARPWPGAVALHGSVEDAGYRLNTVVDAASVIGVTQTVLSAAQPAIWDNGAPLTVKLVRGALETVSLQALFSGANALAIGDGSVGNWEIFQFRQAELIAPDTWALTQRLRGQRGTEAFIPDEWPIGSLVVLLNGLPQQISLPQETLTVPRHFRVGPARLPVDHESYTHIEAQFSGAGLRPFAPAHLRAHRRDAGLDLTWIRRSRIAGDSWDSGTVPLGESSEMYRVAVFKQDGSLALDETVRDTHLSLSNGSLASAGAATGPITISVQQISDVVGPGPAAWVTYL